MQPHLCHFDDVRDVQIGSHRSQPLANQVGLVSLLPVHLARVLLRVDSHSADTQLCAGPEHTNGDLTYRGRRVSGNDKEPYWSTASKGRVTDFSISI